MAGLTKAGWQARSATNCCSCRTTVSLTIWHFELTAKGVVRVKNEIEALPLSPDDDRIRMAEYKATYGGPAPFTGYGYRALPAIHIIVKNGDVTLVGVVANESNRIMANIRANASPISRRRVSTSRRSQAASALMCGLGCVGLRGARAGLLEE